MRRTALLIALAVVALQALLIPLFAAPAAHLAPRDLPIAVAGPPQLAAQLAAAHPGAFEITTVSGPAAADAAIKDRRVYGAIVVTATGPEVHVASAASPTVAQLLTQAAATTGQSAAQPGQAAGQAAGQAVPVRDVVPVDAGDPRGAGFAAGFLPLAITSLLAGILIFFFVPRRAARLLAVITFAAAAGLAAGAVLVYWLGILPGSYLAVAGALALFALAVSGAMAGLGAALDRGGLALGGAVLFLVGNALSGIAAAPELLPQPWGAVGQALPVGAGSTLLRSVAYFDGHGAGAAAGVLTAYAAGGLILIVIGGRRLARKPVEARAEAAPEPVPAH
jgi:hypothetical protein